LQFYRAAGLAPSLAKWLTNNIHAMDYNALQCSSVEVGHEFGWPEPMRAVKKMKTIALIAVLVSAPSAQAHGIAGIAIFRHVDV
jgi:hypothetical protein